MLGRRLAALCLINLVACGAPPAEVVIASRVETPIDAEATPTDAPQIRPSAAIDPGALAEAARRQLGAASRWWRVFGSEDPSIVEQATALRADRVLAPPSTPAEFEAALEAIRNGPIDELSNSIRNIAAVDPGLWPQVREELLRDLDHGKREYRLLLAVIGGDVPNRYGTFELRWKKTHGHAVKLSEDWYEDLLAVEPGQISKAMRPVLRETLLSCALLQAVPRIAAEDPRRMPEIVDALLDAAYVHEGTFRDEVGRSIDRLGDGAVPWLMAHSVAPEEAKEGSPEERRAAYSIFCLDRLDRLQPQRAIAAVASDRRVLAEVLGKFALTRDGEAAPLLLAWIDHDNPGVRSAARESFEAYVTGPLPKTRRKAIRLLGGKTTERVAELGYREHARLAIRAYLAEHEPDLLEEECRLVLPDNLVDETCERQPERLYRALVARLDRARASRRTVRISTALAQSDPDVGVAMLDEVLSEGVALPDPTPLARYYEAVALGLADRGEAARAARLMRKSAMLIADLQPIRAREATVEALVLEAEADGVDERGRAMLLASAARLDPDSTEVAAGEIRMAEASASARQPLERQLAFGFVGVLGLVGGAGLIGRRRR